MASLAATVAPNLLWLDVARVVQGAGAAAIMVDGILLPSDRYTGEERNLAIGAWGSFATAAALLAPTLGGVLADAFGWRAVFAVNPPLRVAAWVLAARVLSRSPVAPGAGRPDWLGGLLLVLGLGMATLLMLRPDDARGSGQDTAVLCTACLTPAVFPAVQLRVPVPTLELRMFRPAHVLRRDAGRLPLPRPDHRRLGPPGAVLLRRPRREPDRGRAPAS